MAKHVMWDSLRAGPGGQGMDWDGNDLRLAASGGNTMVIPAADLLSMLRAALDSAVLNEGRAPRGDTFRRARDAIGGSAGNTHSGFTYSTVVNRGTQMVQTSNSATFDIANSHAWAVAISNLCQSQLSAEAGLLARM